MLIPKTECSQIIMVSYFRPNDLKKSVLSILNNTNHHYHLSIIDNSNHNIDDTLNLIESIGNNNITIYNNDINIGKGNGFMRWYNEIMSKTDNDYLISIDGDIEVEKDWLIKLKVSMNEIRKFRKFGIIAPTIKNNKIDTFDSQLRRQKLIMHKLSDTSKLICDNVYYNRYLAGPLLMIDCQFFESNGGYNRTQLYGNEDGELCKSAYEKELFIGIATNVEVTHLNSDSTIEYNNWKVKNIHSKNSIGHWDGQL